MKKNKYLVFNACCFSHLVELSCFTREKKFRKTKQSGFKAALFVFMIVFGFSLGKIDVYPNFDNAVGASKFPPLKRVSLPE